MGWQDVVGALGAGPPGPRERALEEEVRQELEAHIAMCTEDNIAAGMEPAAARRDAEQRAQHLMYELRSKYEPEDELVFRVGDRVDIRGFGPDIVEVVQRDGKLLVPDVGWMSVAGRTRTEVESELRRALEPFHERPPTINLVVVEDAADL